MKKELSGSFMERVSKYGALLKKQKEVEKPTPVVITSYSQPHVLQQRMKEEKLSHGDRVTANLSPVRLESNFGKMVLYFCPMQSIEVMDRLETGDGAALPPEAIINGIEVPGNFKPGLYSLQNAELFSNGTLQVNATKDTKFVSLMNEPAF